MLHGFPAIHHSIVVDRNLIVPEGLHLFLNDAIAAASSGNDEACALIINSRDIGDSSYSSNRAVSRSPINLLHVA